MARLAPPLWLICAALAVAPVGSVSAAAAEPSNDAAIHQLRLEKFVLPDFPDFVRLTGGARGVVTVAIGRDAEGRVTDVLVLSSSHARLTQSVVEAVMTWRFARPANQPLPGRPIVPIVRFLFSSKGVLVLSGLAAGAAAPTADLRDDAPVVLPSPADLETSAEPVQRPMPTITGPLAARLADGSATVKFFIDEHGRVRVPIVLESTAPEFGDAAIASVEQWRYEPPRIGGRPTIAIETATFQFRPPRS